MLRQPRLVKIGASLLSADFANLTHEVAEVTAAGADFIHIDVMDGKFVPNITCGPKLVSDVKKHSKLPLDIHLMINEPEHYIPQFINAGADVVTIHVESTKHIHRALSLIQIAGKKVGVALNPATPESALEYIYDLIDLVLVMTVNPGFAAQTFLSSQLIKIQRIKARIMQVKQSINLAVDGGINEENAKLVVQAGADIIVAGTAIFSERHQSSQDYTPAINQSESGRATLLGRSNKHIYSKNIYSLRNLADL